MADTNADNVAPRKGVTLNLDQDPNDPRRTPRAKANLSNLNEEDPEKEPVHQNPVN
jgi:hypothetical protein